MGESSHGITVSGVREQIQLHQDLTECLVHQNQQGQSHRRLQSQEVENNTPVFYWVELHIAQNRERGALGGNKKGTGLLENTSHQLQY